MSQEKLSLVTGSSGLIGSEVCRHFAELGYRVMEKELLRKISPVFLGDMIRKPLLLLLGANDPRVLKAVSDDIVAAVNKNNVPVEYFVFADVGQGLTNKKNQIEG